MAIDIISFFICICQPSTFNLEKNKSICQKQFFVHLVKVTAELFVKLFFQTIFQIMFCQSVKFLNLKNFQILHTIVHGKKFRSNTIKLHKSYNFIPIRINIHSFWRALLSF